MVDVVYNTAEVKEFPGYYRLKDYPYHAINVDGVVILIATGKKITAYVMAGSAKKRIRGGYRMYRLRDVDFKVRNISRHRLLCLTFKEIPTDPKKVIVNHLNGIGGDDRLDNLEWCSYSENTKHAYRTGLHSKKVRAIEMFSPDGKVTRFDMVILAVEASGLSEHTVTGRLGYPGSVRKDGYGFRNVGDTTSWHCFIKSAAVVVPFYFRDLYTGIVKSYDSVHIAGRVLGYNPQQIRAAVDGEHRAYRVLGCYEISRSPDGPWTDYTEEQVRYLVNYPAFRFPLKIVARNIYTGVTATFEDAVEASVSLGYNRNSVRKIAGEGGTLNGWKLSTEEVF